MGPRGRSVLQEPLRRAQWDARHGQHRGWAMRVGERDGYGRYGMLDETSDGLLCHECGQRFTHLGLHVYRRHGMTAAAYRQEHGLGRRGLVVAVTREVIAANARDQITKKPAFLQRRDPARASAAGRSISPAGLEAIRSSNRARRGHARRGAVVVCAWCGVAFCPLTHAKRRRFRSRSHASKYARARR